MHKSFEQLHLVVLEPWRIGEDDNACIRNVFGRQILGRNRPDCKQGALAVASRFGLQRKFEKVGFALKWRGSDLAADDQNIDGIADVDGCEEGVVGKKAVAADCRFYGVGARRVEGALDSDLR